MTTVSLALWWALVGCGTPQPYLSEPEITSEVDDWRDEVIYQVMVDRFANGDRNNDFNVTQDPTALARYHGGDWQGLMNEADYLVGYEHIHGKIPGMP